MFLCLAKKNFGGSTHTYTHTHRIPMSFGTIKSKLQLQGTILSRTALKIIMMIKYIKRPRTVHIIILQTYIYRCILCLYCLLAAAESGENEKRKKFKLNTKLFFLGIYEINRPIRQRTQRTRNILYTINILK